MSMRALLWAASLLASVGEPPPISDDAFEPVEITTPERHDAEPAGVQIAGVVMHPYEEAPIVGAHVVLDDGPRWRDRVA